MKRKVLLVDDNAANRKLIRDLLNHTKLEIIEARNGPQAVEMAIRQNPSLILLELDMPVMSGREVYTILRQNPSTRRIPIIALTSESADTAAEATGFSVAGFNDLLSKPIPIKTLVGKIQPYVNIANSMAREKAYLM